VSSKINYFRKYNFEIFFYSRRIRDKYETEFRELENSEKQTKEKYNQIKAQMTEVQGIY
jgi:hypothetical protein